MIHRMYLGDCREVMRSLEPRSVDVVITDPPYGDTSLEWDVPILDWIGEVARVLKPSGSVWIFGSMRALLSSWDDFYIGHDIGWRLAQDIVWEKQAGSSFAADRFKRVHEHAIQLYLGEWGAVYKAPQRERVYSSDKGTVRRSANRTQHTGTVGRSTWVDDGTRLLQSVLRVRNLHHRAEHPTQKPVGILEPLIAYSCPPGGMVLDPFAGVGSTLVAAKNLGRDAIGIETQHEYVQIAERRLAQEVMGLAG